MVKRSIEELASRKAIDNGIVIRIRMSVMTGGMRFGRNQGTQRIDISDNSPSLELAP